MSRAPTLDEWVELANLTELREQFLVTCQQYVSPAAAESLTRCLMIMVRQEFESAPDIELTDHFGPHLHAIARLVDIREKKA